ncbi:MULTISPECIES: hypothetical protein [Rhodanobacter]|uniref:Uncharacterized protein n=1 Tax=Rhodanobacter denitrificans TaxID=666685 RepID=M4NCC0_9GAMM|nr:MULTISPECIES: hypothetical protein [Rhodanobacter]AGG88320.1 hypothetical protein R2APBS1_1166 [Rhodanobacter denitrificans]KZC19847.1 hypothetical protein RHOFW104R3_28975 [Rhodanobacter denitrificans]UJJ52221.1 hypothetical protein LRK52_05885 [Rhodanobacter denitrificans]UJJ59000.1 hypothetical protein LRK55_02360 [Rhodanobacter denitrificans]UJM87462.1 hypothetical protein LRJ86_03900 [Rhodanobacter denitrificans]
MHQRPSAATWILLALAIACTGAHAAQKEAPPNLFDQLQSLSGELARYDYLIATTPQLTGNDQSLAQQMLAFSENELGLYSEAVRDFPLRNELPKGLTAPQADRWQAVDGVDAIAALARNRRLVMVNEAHHDGHTRELTLMLLPRLRAEGYTHFAAEALDRRDVPLMKRGYPVTSSGSEYLHEPLYGDIVREAIRLGYVIVPYEAVDATPQGREDGQARNLYEQVFAHNPEAKLFVHAGYAHIDKQRGRIGSTRPMAMQLSKLSGLDPLSVDQTDVREENPENEALAYHAFRHALRKYETLTQTARQSLNSNGPGDLPARPVTGIYTRIVATFHPSGPIALLRTADHTPWSARPGAYDLNIILPPANPVPSDYTQGPLWLSIDGEKRAVLPPANNGHRPDWLSLGGQRVAVPVDSESCEQKFPCLVEAHYATESANAIAADRYLFLRHAKNVLYLRPGTYRLRSIGADGRTMNEHTIAVATP